MSETSNDGLGKWYAVTPAGTLLAHLESETRQECIDGLMADLHRHNMPYPDWAAAERRGYTVEQIDL
jgi:hypothetical protein